MNKSWIELVESLGGEEGVRTRVYETMASIKDSLKDFQGKYYITILAYEEARYIFPQKSDTIMMIDGKGYIVHSISGVDCVVEFVTDSEQPTPFNLTINRLDD